jgi:peptidoglycan/LPS O-acetylase OafA/YrhL
MKPPLSARQNFDAFKATSYFSALDGLRAVSILMVLFHHVPKYPAQHFLHTLQDNGRYGVAFFFVISGFLICTLFLREEEQTGRIGLWKFYGRRALRLLPLYYAALLVQAALVFVVHQYTPEHQELFRQKLPAYLFYYSNWLPTATQGPFFCAWSLAVEEQFYLLFGLLMFFGTRRFVVGSVLAVLLIKALVFAAFDGVNDHSAFWRIVFSYQEPILFGVLTAFVLNSRRGYAFFARGLGHAWLPACMGAGMAAWLYLHSMQTQSSWDALLLYLLMTLVLICLVVRPAGPVLGGRFMTHVGKISYGIYLLHMFVISTVKKLPHGESQLPCFFISAIAVIVIASLVYKYFEHPIIAFYKRKLSPLRSRRADLKPSAGVEVLPDLPHGLQAGKMQSG